MGEGPAIIPFYDYYEAHLFAHGLQLEGCRTEVLDFGWYNFGFWPTAPFRVLAFPPLTKETEVVEEPLRPGPIGRAIDAYTNAAVCIVVLLVVPAWILLLFPYSVDNGIPTGLVLLVPTLTLLAPFLGAFGQRIYEGSRRNSGWEKRLFDIATWVIVLLHAGVGLLFLLPVLLGGSTGSEEQ